MNVSIAAIKKKLPAPVRRTASRIRAIQENIFVIPYYVLLRGRRRRALTEFARKKKPVVLFLAPEAGLTPFFAAHSLLARTLEENDQTAIVLSCRGSLPTCAVKHQARSADDHPKVCINCRKAALKVGAKYGLKDIAIESLIGRDIKKTIDSILTRSRHEPWSLVHDGIEFGRFALGEVLRDRRKLEASELDDSETAALVVLLSSALRVYFAVEIIAARFNVKRIVYYGAYAWWLPAVLFARRNAIPTTQIEHGYNRDIDFRLINLRPLTVHEQQTQQIAEWPRYRHLPLEPHTITSILESALYRLNNNGGISTHSPNWTRRERPIQEELGLSRHKKTIVAFSSSADEYIGGVHILNALGANFPERQHLFEDSETWLKRLTSWARGRDDLQLIVRLHPRLANSRGGQPAAKTELSRLRDGLAGAPENVLVVWPQDKISSYNLAEVADVALVAWSTMGLELARFGVPVIACVTGVSYPVGSFIGFEASPDAYFAAVSAAVHKPASHELITEAFRWTNFLFLSPTVDFSDLVPRNDYWGFPDWRMPARSSHVVRALVHGDDASELQMAELPRGFKAVAAEREAIRRAVERMILLMVTGQDRPRARIGRLTVESEKLVTLKYDGETFRSYSPLAHRLAALWQKYSADSIAAGF